MGSLEAKAEGETLMGVEGQADRYADGFEEQVKGQDLPRYHDRLPLYYMSTGTGPLRPSQGVPARRCWRSRRRRQPR
ncbi:MAG: hypothetical protein WKF96_21590 [Solirubrobacteraceae bacterium]